MGHTLHIRGSGGRSKYYSHVYELTGPAADESDLTGKENKSMSIGLSAHTELTGPRADESDFKGHGK
jgi:hypothetical protein